MYFGDEGAKILAANTTLTTLFASLNKIGDEGAKAFSVNTTIRFLDLSDNNIGNAGMKALTTNTNFTQLNICDNEITITSEQPPIKNDPIPDNIKKPLIKLDHNLLMEIMNQFGYPHLERRGGVCNGFSKMLASAIHLGLEEKERFYRRLNVLVNNVVNESSSTLVNADNETTTIRIKEVSKEKVAILLNKISEIYQKVNQYGITSLSDEEYDYYEIPAFLNGVYVNQFPDKEPDLFDKHTTLMHFNELNEITMPKSSEIYHGARKS